MRRAEAKTGSQSHLERAAAHFGTVRDKPPKGAFSSEEYIKFQGLSRSASSNQLRRMVQDGRLESRKYLVNGRWTIFFWTAK